MIGSSCFLVVIVILQVFHSSLYVHGKESESSSFIRCKKHELEALLKFKQSFTNDPMKRLSSWVGRDCCQWHEVTCDNVTHNIIKLNLRSLPRHHYYLDHLYDYTDYLPDHQVSMVSSAVSSALLELKLLTHLDLSGNNFLKSQIPEFLGSLRHLRYLNLSSAGFAGPLPPQLGNLTNLVHLDLHVDLHVCFELKVPLLPVDSDYYDDSYLYSEDLEWASGLFKLESLDMSGFDLYSAYGTFEVLSSLPSLSALSLSKCVLDNSHLPEAFTSNTSNSFFPTLQLLNLVWNYFEGPLPPVLKNLVSLRSLSLSYNSFNGSVPLWLRAMSHLEALDLSNNGFIYVENGIMGNSCNLKHLDLSVNNISRGDIIGSIVMWCGAFELEYLDLSGNTMVGSLPSLGQLTNLNYLDLSYNKLSGLIPDFIGHLTQIEHLDISVNSLQGTVFGIGNLSKLSYLDMNYNHLILKLDSSVNWQPPFQLRVFHVHSCLINTVFPQWLRNQTHIASLDLSDTGISGELPKWLWNSSYLQNLLLSGNGLTGSMYILS